ncbi:ephrin-A4-like [Pangshura tecta]
MRPALLLRLLLWGALLWGRLRPGRSLRHSVYWNSSNPRFLHEDYAVQVSINDYLDIYCPHYDHPVPAGRAETFSLHMVDTEGYRGCYETPGAFKRWECNRPHAPFGPVRFSEKIQRFTPFSLGFEFQPGETYYYISVPSPESAGRCLRLRVAVCCKATTMKPVTEVPKSQPRGRGGRRVSMCVGGCYVPHGSGGQEGSRDTESPGHSTALATLRPHGPCLSLALIPLPLLWL